MQLDPPPPPKLPSPPPLPVIATFHEVRTHIAEDFRANRNRFWAPGFQALAAYRLGVWSRSVRWKILRVPVRLLAQFGLFFARNFYGIELSTKTRIGRRLEIAHQHGITIHPYTTIGDDCLIRQGVSVGGLRPGRMGPRGPVVGDRVEFGAGAIVAGAVRIGDDAVIGPNAVVMTNVPPGSIVASPQSRIVAPPPRRADGRAGGRADVAETNSGGDKAKTNNQETLG